ncbi:MAG: ABC transporter permease [Solirubrobacteraceae bacterium]
MLAYRYLFEQMVRRELRQKYKGSVLGVAWYFINPLVLMGAYGVMFGKFLPLPRIPDYLIFLIVGIVVWTFFQQSLLSAAPSLVEQSSLVRKARFPRETIPAASVAVQAVTLAILMTVVVVVSVSVRGTLGFALLLLPVLIACLLGFALGLGLAVSSLHAHFRDVAPILSAALLPWFFLTPIFFRPDTFPFFQRHAFVRGVIEWGNPVAPFIEAIRAVLYEGRVPTAGVLVYVVAAAALALGLGRVVFRRLDRELAVVL